VTHARDLIGDTRVVIAQVPEGSIELVPATSSLRLRSPSLPAGDRRNQLKWAFKGGCGL
jgi:hypothetical protein